MQSNQLRSYLFAGLSILGWSTISTAFKLSLVHLSPLGLLLVSSCTATIFLLLCCMGSGLFKLREVWTNIRASLLAGFLNPALYYLVLFTAYSRLRAQEAQALNYTWAIVLSLFSVIMLHEKFKLRDLAALLISFLGVVVISTKGTPWNLHFDDAWGSFLAAGSSLIWAGYWIINIKDRRPAVLKLFYNFLTGFVMIAIISIVSGQKLVFAGSSIILGILGGVYVGLFEMGLTFLLWQKALELTESTAKISNLIFVTPFVSLLFIRMVLQEAVHPATLAGLLMIIGSNIYQKLGHSSKENPLQKNQA